MVPRGEWIMSGRSWLFLAASAYSSTSRTCSLAAVFSSVISTKNNAKRAPRLWRMCTPRGVAKRLVFFIFYFFRRCCLYVTSGNQDPAVRTREVASAPAHLYPTSAMTRTNRLIAGFQLIECCLSLLLGRRGDFETLALRAAEAFQPYIAGAAG